MDSKIRYAVVGLGHIVQTAVLPGFANASENSQLTALITDHAERAKELAAKYGVNKFWMYDELDEALASGAFDALYIATPNDLHKEIAIRAANAKIHVLCEKPMAMNATECAEMIAAADKNSVKLMIGYRLQFEPTNLNAIKAIQEGRIGEPRVFTSNFCLQVDAGNYRVRAKHGGGPLMDIGLYCINAARHLFKQEPIEVFGTAVRSSDPRFAEIEEAISVIMKFPNDKLASFTCSFGAYDTLYYEVVGTTGSLKVDPAYEYRFDLHYFVKTEKGTEHHTTPAHDQFAKELIHFSQCILENEEPIPSGKEGLADMRIVDAIFESVRLNKPVLLNR